MSTRRTLLKALSGVGLVAATGHRFAARLTPDAKSALVVESTELV